MSIIAVSSDTCAEFSKNIGRYLGASMLFTRSHTFPNGEIYVAADWRALYRSNVCIVAPLDDTPNNFLIKTLFTVNAAKSIGAKTVLVCVPYLCCSRQDCHPLGSEFSASNTVANLLNICGADKIITLHIHNKNLTALRSNRLVSVDPDFMIDKHAAHSNITDLSEITFVSPDRGRAAYTKNIAKTFGSMFVACKKTRLPGNKIKIDLGENVQEKKCIIIDDILDSGATLLETSTTLYNAGAKNIGAVVTHATNLSNNLLDKIEMSQISALSLSNSINSVSEACINRRKISVISCTQKLAESIKAAFSAMA
ncbi:ribose-phosphate diphosphokinase [Candidatus Hydrogenosomobacter endosymbioticus]|nr:ribose-phosphate diphosphokinase [Candidatus Hydrogenosomobacter endosymbioticus]